MKLIEHPLYIQDVKKAAEFPLKWHFLENRSILIAGATGMIGSFLIDVLMYRNRHYSFGCNIIAIGRNRDKAEKRFSDYWNDSKFRFVEANININIDYNLGNIDYIIHAASNTHPLAYATDPIGTVEANVIGTRNLLELAANQKKCRFIFVSSVEIYGENRGDIERFREDYCGYIDCNTLRAGYPESKRVGEALCQAYIRQKELDVVIARLSRVYGPTMLMSDTKALSQFIMKAIADEDIILKSAGTQYYSYSYVADAAVSLLYCMCYGVCGEAYNVSDLQSDIALRDLAKIIADYAGKSIVFELPDEVENAGYSKATKAVLDNSKLCSIGWYAGWNLRTGLEHTIQILKDIR